jgi:hypothetical protein
VSAAAILRDAAADGVEVTLRDGRLTATGNDAAVNRWVPELRAEKEQVINLLRWPGDEVVIRRWLAEIGEDDQHLVALTLRWCQTDAESRAWALALAASHFTNSYNVVAECVRDGGVAAATPGGHQKDSGLLSGDRLVSHAEIFEKIP